jgi:hypothetical protein
MERWLTRGVVGSALWPPEEKTIKFSGYELLLKDATKDREQSISICLKNMNEKEATKLFNQFLSILCWCDGQPIRLIEGIIGPAPGTIGRGRQAGSSLPEVFNYFNRTPISDPQKRLALALYREAVTVNSMAYSFLGFYKVIVACLGENKNTNNKIAEILPKLTDERAKDRIKELEKNDVEIPKYLYEERRHAIAHVTKEPVINPDEEDIWILSGDVYIVRAIAEYLIEKKLKISRTIFSDKQA